MSVKWLIVDFKNDSQQNLICKGLDSLGIENSMISMKDVYLDNVPYNENDNVFVYAPIMSTTMLTKKFKWLNWMPLDKLKCSNYYPYFEPTSLLQEVYTFMPSGCLVDHWNRLVNIFGEDGLMFIRPDGNNKRFTGDVFSNSEYLSLYRGLEPDIMCVISKPIRVEKEWRVLMLNGEPIEGSTYWFGEDTKPYRDLPTEVGNFCKTLWEQAKSRNYESLPSMIHFDVAKIGLDEYKLVELSSVNSAGTYDMNIDNFIKAVHNQAEKEYAENIDY